MSKLDPTIGQPESLQIVLDIKIKTYTCMYVRNVITLYVALIIVHYLSNFSRG